MKKYSFLNQNRKLVVINLLMHFVIKTKFNRKVAMFISSIKTFLSMLGGVKLFSNKESAQIWIVSSSGIQTVRTGSIEPSHEIL